MRRANVVGQFESPATRVLAVLNYRRALLQLEHIAGGSRLIVAHQQSKAGACPCKVWPHAVRCVRLDHRINASSFDEPMNW